MAARHWLLVSALAIAACSADERANAPPGPGAPDADQVDAADVDAAEERGFDSSDTGPDGDESAPAADAGDAFGPDRASDDGGEADVVDASAPLLCVRLYDPAHPNQHTVLAEQVDKEYVQRVYRDCDVAKMARTELDTIFEFFNDLLFFSLDLWGCTLHQPNEFGLKRSIVTDLTSADAARLIDHYIGAATTILRLDMREAAQMRQDLTKLAALAITRQSDEFALSMCVSDAGGEEAAASGDAAGDAGGVTEASDEDRRGDP
jgi:hypothetical protein